MTRDLYTLIYVPHFNILQFIHSCNYITNIELIYNVLEINWCKNTFTFAD